MMRPLLVRIARNVAGLLLLLLGALLGFVPFLPGIVLGALGIALLDFPGKRRLLLRIGRLRPFRNLCKRSPALARLWREMSREKPRLTSQKPLE